MFSDMGVPCVDLKWEGKVDDFKKLKVEDFLGNSAYYDGKPEGIVIKNYDRANPFGNQMFAKIVNEDFKELNHATFGSIKKDNSDALKLVEYSITPARVNKRILELVDAGAPLDRKLMAQLPMSVLKDVFKEEGEWMFKNLKHIDVPTFKQLAAKECLKVLDERIYELKAKELPLELTDKVEVDQRLNG
jgi:hypothetical protein